MNKHKRLIIDVKRKTKDGGKFVNKDVSSCKFLQRYIYNVYSVKTKQGWCVINCPDRFFNRPPQIGMFISANKHKKIFEITGRSGR